MEWRTVCILQGRIGVLEGLDGKAMVGFGTTGLVVDDGERLGVFFEILPKNLPSGTNPHDGDRSKTPSFSFAVPISPFSRLSLASVIYN